MIQQSTKTRKVRIVGDICLYGTSHTGAGYLGVIMPHGQTFGTGEPVKDRTFTEAIMRAMFDARQLGAVGYVRIFDTGGERMSIVDVNSGVYYGGLTWQPAPQYVISADALNAAEEVR